MKSAFLATVLVLPLAQGVAAQTISEMDWSGPYAGLTYGRTNDSDDLLNAGVFSSLQEFEGSGVGLFLGYNVQRDAMVYGVELAFSPYEVNGTNNSGLREDYVDLKGRLGYSTGKMLIYGVLGYSFATTLESSDPANDLSANGVNFGIGLDYMVTDRIFAGAELLGRRLDGDYGDVGFPGFTHETDSMTLSVRLGMSF